MFSCVLMHIHHISTLYCRISRETAVLVGRTTDAIWFGKYIVDSTEERVLSAMSNGRHSLRVTKAGRLVLCCFAVARQTHSQARQLITQRQSRSIYPRCSIKALQKAISRPPKKNKQPVNKIDVPAPGTAGPWKTSWQPYSPSRTCIRKTETGSIVGLLAAFVAVKPLHPPLPFHPGVVEEREKCSEKQTYNICGTFEIWSIMQGTITAAVVFLVVIVIIVIVIISPFFLILC